MTKAEKIRKLAAQHPDWGCTRLGRACDCNDSYVRVVLRQRIKGRSPSDHRYDEKMKERLGISRQLAYKRGLATA
jgi:hypothetical protein